MIDYFKCRSHRPRIAAERSARQEASTARRVIMACLLTISRSQVSSMRTTAIWGAQMIEPYVMRS